MNDVEPETDLGDKIKGGIVTHNHPLGSANEYSFSNADINLFMDNELKILRGVDDMFNYEFSISDKSIDDDIPIFEMTEYDVRHCQVIERAQQLNIGYRRERI